MLSTLTSALATHNLESVTELNVSDNALGFAGLKACGALLSGRLRSLKCNNCGLESDSGDFITKSLMSAGMLSVWVCLCLHVCSCVM